MCVSIVDQNDLTWRVPSGTWRKMPTNTINVDGGERFTGVTGHDHKCMFPSTIAMWGTVPRKALLPQLWAVCCDVDIRQ